eukprot:COSAG05_NODE_106_length_18750_cov_677.083105_18_plen_78_part_00
MRALPIIWKRTRRYDIEVAFESLASRFPAIDRHIASSMRATWLSGRSGTVLREADPAAFAALSSAESMHGKMRAYKM